MTATLTPSATRSFSQHAYETIGEVLQAGGYWGLSAGLIGSMSIGTAAVFGAMVSFMGEVSVRAIVSQLPPENATSWRVLSLAIIAFVGSCIGTFYLISAAGYVLAPKNIALVFCGAIVIKAIWNHITN